MKNVSVREVPDDIHRALMAKAVAEGVSLQTYLLRAFEDLAQIVTNAEANARLATEVASMASKRSTEPAKAMVAGPAATVRRALRDRD